MHSGPCRTLRGSIGWHVSKGFGGRAAMCWPCVYEFEQPVLHTGLPVPTEDDHDVRIFRTWEILLSHCRCRGLFYASHPSEVCRFTCQFDHQVTVGLQGGAGAGKVRSSCDSRKRKSFILSGWQSTSVRTSGLVLSVMSRSV